jgi:hypothetical protein
LVSNSAENRVCTDADHSSAPYPAAVPVFAAAIASIICGAAAPVLSLRKSMMF